MGRILVPIAVIVAIAAAGWGIYLLISYLIRRRERRHRERKQRDLANFAPAVLNGSPLVDVVIDQGKQLETAAEILRGLTSDGLHVYLPTDHSQRIRAWLQKHEERKAQ